MLEVGGLCASATRVTLFGNKATESRFLSSFCCAAKVQAGADVSSLPGRGSSSVHVKANGKDRMRLNAQMSHSVQGGDRAAALTVNVSQSLLGSTAHLHVELAANVSAEKSEFPL